MTRRSTTTLIHARMLDRDDMYDALFFNLGCSPRTSIVDSTRKVAIVLPRR